MATGASRSETVLSFLIGGLLGVGLVVLTGRDVRRVLGSGDYCRSRSRWRAFR